MAAITCLALAVGLSGCPVAADLEDPLRFDALPKPGGAGMGSTDCVQALPATTDPAVACEYPTFVTQHCARGGCHNASFKSAGLDMSLADGLLIARLVDVPARHGSITCSGTTDTCDPAVRNCENCMSCVAGDLLINKTTFAESWMVKKIDAFNVDNVQEVRQMQCGTAMPYMPGNTGFTAERRDCLKRFFQWIATNGRKCDVLPPAAAGSGGGGAGGSGGAPTAGAGGT